MTAAFSRGRLEAFAPRGDSHSQEILVRLIIRQPDIDPPFYSQPTQQVVKSINSLCCGVSESISKTNKKPLKGRTSTGSICATACVNPSLPMRHGPNPMAACAKSMRVCPASIASASPMNDYDPWPRMSATGLPTSGTANRFAIPIFFGLGAS